MTIDDIYLCLKKTGYPVAYSHFNESVKCPFITYLISHSSNFYADNKAYKKIDNIQIELYTIIKDLEAEKKLEDILNENELTWDVSEMWIQSEKVYQRIYEVRLI